MRNLFLKLTAPINMPFWWQDLLFAIPRIVGGWLFTVNFGASKFGLPWSPADANLHFFEVAYWFPDDVSEYGGVFALFPVFWAWMGAFSEGVGGVFLMFGFQTRLFSFLGICTMAVAAFVQQWDNGLWSMLASMGFLWINLYTLVLGSGRFGVDYLISKKFKA